MKAIIDAKELKRIIDNTKKFVDINGMMMFLRMEIDAEKMMVRATALDGYRISVEYARVIDADKSFTCYIKPIALKITKYVHYATIELENGRALIQVGDTTTEFTQPENEYPNVDRVLEVETKKEVLNTIGVNTKYLKDALESTKDIRQTRDIIRLEIRKPNEAITIKTKGYDGLPDNIKLVLPVKLATV